MNNINISLLPKQFVLKFKDRDYFIVKASLRAYRTFADEIKTINPKQANKILDKYDQYYESSSEFK